MAIYSCAVSTVGRSTHAAGTAGAHLRYIGRPDAATTVEAAHMPAHPRAARRWMDVQEREARKNARLLNKIRAALPRELSHAQNAELVREFLMLLTSTRIPWFYAIHDQGEDRQNPHVHIVLIDKDIETGKRLLRLSDSPKDRETAGLVPNGVEWIRAIWEGCVNLALERAGFEARIDRRSLAAQGIDREPTIHIGPRANHIDRTVRRPVSKVVPSPTPRHPERVIDYPMIAERVTMHRQQNRLTARFMAAIDITGQTRRNRTAALQALDERHKRERAGLAAYVRQTRSMQADAVRARYQPEIDAIKQTRRQEVAALKERHRGDMLREDDMFQFHEAEREHGRGTLKQQIDNWKNPQRGSSNRQTANY